MDHQAELLELLDRLEEVEEEKKQAVEDFNASIKRIKSGIKDQRRELRSKSKSQTS